MRLVLIGIVLLCLIWCGGLTGCSKAKEEEKKASKVETPAGEPPNVLREHTQAPVRKARAAHDSGDQRLEDTDAAVKGNTK
jgi:hypothetical protein